jgi:hypothetical protein
MKRQALSLISLLSLLLMAGSAIAQTIHVHGNIPFNFAVGNKTFPAGAYDVDTIASADAKLLLLRAQDGRSSMIVGSNSAAALKRAEKTKLVFNHYGNQYFLAEVWVEGAISGRQLQTSSREKELAKELAGDLTQPRVEVLASLY